MNWWKKHKWHLIIPLIVVAVLAAAFWYGGNSPSLHGWSAGGDTPEPALQAGTPEPQPSPAEEPDPAPGGLAPAAPGEPEAAPQEPAEAAPATPAQEPETPESQPQEPAEPQPPAQPLPEEPAGAPAPAEQAPESPDPAPAPDPGSTTAPEPGGTTPPEPQEPEPAPGEAQPTEAPTPAENPLPVDPQDAEITDTAYTCTISISCETVLNHMDWLDPAKTDLIPEDGWVLAPVEVTFYEGESVFHVLQRTCKQQAIHLEFENIPLYNSAYIEGIQNLYEFDCGELSGWMYHVNGWFPNYGSSRYALKDGDVICWEYTCDLGADIGGSNFPEG